jgi:phage repressor protein C with HTH and peptisase S24 domain
MALGQIIRKRREDMGLTLDEVAHKVGFSKPYISTVETGRVNNPPSEKLLSKLEVVLGFEPGTLQYMANIERMPADVRREIEQTDAENRHLKKMLQLLKESGGDLSRIKGVLDKLDVNCQPAHQVITPGHLIPIINKTTAGYPADFTDMDYPAGVADEYVRGPDIHDPNAFAVRVVGDSMEPEFVEGDIVIISPNSDVSNGDDCFVRFKNPHETTFKRVYFEDDGQIRLQPRNQSYRANIVDGSRIDGIFRAVVRYQRL